MDIYTMDRGFKKVKEIDAYESAIWTDRYYGDGGVVLTVPPTQSMIDALPKGTFLGEVDSNEPMIIETIEIEKGLLKATGITLTEWLNNRFIRTTFEPATKEWKVTAIKPGKLMADIVQNWCIASQYLTDTTWLNSFWPNDGGTPPVVFAFWPTNMGMDSTIFAIPGLTVASYDSSGSNTDLTVPFGPVYDALKAIGQSYEIGMKTTLDQVLDNAYTLGFRTYKGVDRSSTQTANPLVRFSPDLDSLTDVKELRSFSDYVESIYMYATQINPFVHQWFYAPSARQNNQPMGGPTLPTGFDLRVRMEYLEDIKPEDLTDPPIPYDKMPDNTWPGNGTPSGAAQELYTRARLATQAYLKNHKGANIVDGQILDTNQFQYGTHYNLGDIIEIQGYTGLLQKARVTEYIRSKDKSGAKAYPSVELIA